jgi:hypothetical protein
LHVIEDIVLDVNLQPGDLRFLIEMGAERLGVSLRKSVQSRDLPFQAEE